MCGFIAIQDGRQGLLEALKAETTFKQSDQRGPPYKLSLL
jgi:hypothetical protein